ncbi:ribosomal protein S16 [Gloeophyllum trabeum ATCC 11539]|uniref:Ribosomal protein S16 n=1 Tax=Gloeophyllum trabeum (strain ATCC 11539 / FP-39264 / Madison 617) TaxID=670483 RepID=S7QM08_GLOTA|nr:ribosomal protein S16 [Gloeophyllum trabeum ATCC 11539]EPQ60596.1 ribosomal protein S16 [Gloeophyllum trabeum ATCC 11539]
MGVRLRFSMHGRRHEKIFRLVAVDSRKRRDAKPIETLGVYIPKPTAHDHYKTVQWSVDRIKYWLGVGALPSKPVVRLLELGKILPPDSKYHSNATKPPSPPEPPILDK